MANYGYTVFLKDFMSSKLMGISKTANTTYSKLTTQQQKFQNKVFSGSKNLDGMRAKLNNLSQQQGTATTVKGLRRINIELRKTQRNITKLENLPPKSMIQRIGAAGSGLRDLAGAAGIALGAMAVFNGIKSIARLGLDLETTRIKIETLLSSREKANKLIDDINKFAAATPFENADLQRNAELLLNFGIANEKILPSLKMLGDVSGGNRDKLNSLSLAYAQVQSTGKLMGQDLLQMINAGFNPLEVISRKTGRSMASLKEDMSKGAISAKAVEDAFLITTSAGGRFNGMMEKVSKSGLGKISTLIGNLKTNLAEFSEKYLVPTIVKLVSFGIRIVNGFTPVKNAILNLVAAFMPLFSALKIFIRTFFGVTAATDGAQSVINGLTSVINGLSVAVQIISTGLATLLGWLRPLIPILKVIAIAYGIWTMAQWALNIAMTANPIGVIVLGIAALIGAVLMAYEKIGWFRGAILAAWEAISGFANLIKEVVIGRIKELLSGIMGIGKALMLFFNGEWKAALLVGKKAGEDLLGFGTAKKAIDNAKNIGKNAATAYAKGVAEAGKNKNKGLLDGLMPKVPVVAGGTVSGLGDTPDLTTGIDGITGGGSKQTNITVTFDKLIEQLIIQSETIQEGVDELESRISEALLRVLNSTNQMQTSS